MDPNPFVGLFCLRHLLTPIAVTHYKETIAGFGVCTQYETYKILYVFGVRVAYWSTITFDD